MDSNKYDKGNRIFLISLWMIPIVFYLVFWVIDGAVWCADSDSYVAMHDCREPLYPSLLALLRLICGVGSDADVTDNISLTAMALLQSLLAGISVGSLTCFAVRTYIKEALYDGTLCGRSVYTGDGRKRALRLCIKGRVTSYIILAIPLVISMLNRFAAGRASMYSNSIMTEGITISLYLLAFRYMLEYMHKGTIYSYIMSAVTIFLAISTRKQMYVLLCLFVMAGVYVNMVRQRGNDKGCVYGIIKGLITMSLTVILIVGATLLFDCTYNKIVRHSFIIHTEDNRFITTMALYTSEREYEQYIEPELKDIYLKIYDECDRQGFLMHSSPVGWNAEVSHFADNYDHIQLDTMQLILENYVEDSIYSGFKQSMTKTEKIDAIRASFNRSLIPQETDRLIKVFFNNFVCGIVNTVARRQFILCVYTMFIFAIYIWLTVRCIAGGNRTKTVLSLMTIVAIIGNVALVSAVIFCQTRYTIYNMPLFYITLIVMLWEEVLKRNCHV